jgi:RNA polymerase sigma factor (sigma-70 family)
MSFRPTTPNEQRFNEIVESYGRFLRLTIVRACPPDLGLQYDEIEQEARLRLWKALESEREIQDLSSYLYRIAVTTTLDAVRRVKRKREEQLVVETDDADDTRPVLPHHLMADPSLAPDREAARKQLVQKVQDAVARLPENRRQAVTLHLTGMTTQEIADLLDWTEAKARNLVYRGLDSLRESLREAGIEYEAE